MAVDRFGGDGIESLALARAVAHASLEKKSQDVVILDMRELVTFTDYFVVAGASSDRHARAIARFIGESLRAHGVRIPGIAGLTGTGWVALDLGDVVVHVFQHQERQFYDLEGLWAKAPRIVVEDGRYFIEDLRSSNGTFLKVREQRTLKDGDLLLMGQQPLRAFLGN